MNILFYPGIKLGKMCMKLIWHVEHTVGLASFIQFAVKYILHIVSAHNGMHISSRSGIS
jgi:hypothetical protein